MNINESLKFNDLSNNSGYLNFLSVLNNSKFDISTNIIPKAKFAEDLYLTNDILRRMQGCLVGLAIGDAVGGPYEFETREKRRLKPAFKMTSGGSHNLTKGEWTDDTSLALCLSVSLICKYQNNQYDQLMRFNWWRENGYLSSRQECFDIGNTTSFALKEFSKRKLKIFEALQVCPKNLNDDLMITNEMFNKFNISLRCVDNYNGRKAGNGSLMRLAPIPMFFFGFKKEALLAAENSCITTHDDPEAVDACKLYTALIMGAIEGLSKDVILERGFYENYTMSKLKAEKIINIANGSYKMKDDKDICGNGYVVNALKAALWAFYNDNGSFETGVFLAINLGDDTDTTAAIYGQLAGAFYGLDGISEQWRKDVLHVSAIMNISDWLFLINMNRRSSSIVDDN